MNAPRHPKQFAQITSHSHAFQMQLLDLNRWRFLPRTHDDDFKASLQVMLPIMMAEQEFLGHQREAVASYLADMPDRPADYVRWFESLREWGPGQGDPLFPWLAHSATLEDMRWFLTQEVAGEAGFEDLTALAQVRFEGRPKLEMARTYWDEMGRGNAKGMHGPMLAHLSRALDLDPDPAQTIWPSLALANTMSGMAANRHFAYHAVGALGVIELTAPARAASVDQGLARLGVSAGDRHYFTLHSVLDIKHSSAWNSEVIEPLATSPDIRRALAEGALMRLVCGARCFAAYRAKLCKSRTDP